MTDLWLVLVVTSAICGIAGYVYAKKTGRNPELWAILGVVLNVIAVAILASKETQKEKPSRTQG
jgi:xanthine/uracil permease